MAKANPFLKKATGGDKTTASVSSTKRHGLGRGLDGLLGTKPTPVPAVVKPVASVASVEMTQLELPIMDIERSPYQPRREFKEEELKELAESLKNNGLVQPPSVRKNDAGKWELICGERRLRAAQLAGWKKIRVTVIEADNLTAAAMATTENLQRENLNPIEEASSYKNLQDLFNLTQQEVADRVGKGRATVANSVRLLELPDEVKALVQSALLSVGHAKVLLSVDEEKERILLARDCVNEQLTVRALERKIQKMHEPVEEKVKAELDLPESYIRQLTDKLKKHLGCVVRLSSAATHANGRRTKGVLEIDYLDNDDLDRIISMIGVTVE